MTVECPTCGDSFENEEGMKSHHTQVHDESIAGFEYECTECGDYFTRERRLRGEEPFCSIGCLTESQKKRKTVTCCICGEQFDLPQSRAEKRKTCSKECWSEYMSDYLTGRRSGSDHPQWIEGNKTQYQNGWGEVRSNVLSRDNCRCVLCGATEEESINKYGFGLHVHHIKPVRKFDDPQDAHEKRNLVSLCVSCHRQTEGKETSEQLSMFAEYI